MTVLEVEFLPPDRPMTLAASMDAVAVAMLDRGVPMAVAAEQLQSSIQERFDTETDPNGVPWPEWSESYAPIAEAKNEGILKQTGALMEAATRMEAIVVTNDTVFYRANLLPSFGLAHESGLPNRRNPLPQREFIGLTEQAQAVIEVAFWEWFDGNIELYPTSTGKLGVRHAIRMGGQFIPRSAVGLQPL